jgi:hypothetical protein
LELRPKAMPPATPATAALPASRGVFALLAARPTLLAASPTECPACFAVSSTALRAVSARAVPFFDAGERFAFDVRDFVARALAPFDDFAVLALRAFDGLRFVALPRVLEARVFVSAMFVPPTCFSHCLPERRWYPR